MPNSIDTEIIERIRAAAHPLTGASSDYDRLLELIGERRFVLLGEASHGTHEFYQERAAITRRLIEERRFRTVAVEADFPDANRINRFVRGMNDDRDADQALSSFMRFPRWMWRNTVVRDFVAWLREHNDRQTAVNSRVSFYGLDLYSLHASIEAVIRYLDRVDPEAARRARTRYECFEHFEDSQEYGYAASAGHTEPCEAEVVEQLLEMQRRAVDYAIRDGRVAADEFFSAEQNARLVQNAEEYYRSMFRGRVSSWNLRDRHMAETIQAIDQYAKWHGEQAKIVVWAHNSHLGDARATERAERGEWNVGQLVRERYEREAVLVGFSSYTGTVTASSNWDEDAEHKRVRPGMEGSYEELFHRVEVPNFLLTMSDAGEVADDFREPRLARAIGVIYRPETERSSHYFHTRLTEQFDAVIHFDRTRAVEPLEPSDEWSAARLNEPQEAPETYPSGM